MNYRDIEKRLQAAQVILTSDSINRTSFDSLKTLLSGINPKIDKLLASASKAFKGDVIELTIESWPETTPEDKKRKKAFLLFLKFWNDLKNEVPRVEAELTNNQWGKIFGAAKGPLGIITLIAVGIALLRIIQAEVVIRNHGCKPIEPVTSVSINIPGLKLPNEIIPDGGQVTATLPPLALRVDATATNLVRLTMYGITYDFELGSSDIRLAFDGETLNGKETAINLASQKQHTLDIFCE